MTQYVRGGGLATDWISGMGLTGTTAASAYGSNILRPSSPGPSDIGQAFARPCRRALHTRSRIDMTTRHAPLLGDAPELATVLDFLRGIGIRIVGGAVPGDALLPAMTVRNGVLLYDPARPGWVGDLLHEAGHLAVTDPALRDTLVQVGDDPAEEMAAIAWSYAAAMAIGMPVATLFHAGYKGGPEYLIAAFAGGSPIGLPMLQYWGMAARTTTDGSDDGPAFPAMRTWLRPR
jgi:hypothetical protein